MVYRQAALNIINNWLWFSLQKDAEIEEVELTEVTPELLAETEKSQEKDSKQVYEEDEEVRRIELVPRW